MKLTEFLIAYTILRITTAHAQLNESRLELIERFS